MDNNYFAWWRQEVIKNEKLEAENTRLRIINEKAVEMIEKLLNVILGENKNENRKRKKQ